MPARSASNFWDMALDRITIISLAARDRALPTLMRLTPRVERSARESWTPGMLMRTLTGLSRELTIAEISSRVLMLGA